MKNPTSLYAPSWHRDPNFFRAMLLGLTVGCPCNRSLDTCLINFDRSISFHDKVVWIESLEDSAVMELYSLHRKSFSAELKLGSHSLPEAVF